MRKIKLYIAMSLDGFIAGKDGNVDFLKGQEEGTDNEGTYQDFIKGIDTVLMGWNTYNQVVTVLSPEKWVYENLETYVLTHRKCESSDNVQFTDATIEELVDRLKSKDGKDIWICGGAGIVQQAISANLIDEFYISIIPTILGGGIKLFGSSDKEYKLKLISSVINDGIIELFYTRRV